jgi:hypothetical protein
MVSDIVRDADAPVAHATAWEDDPPRAALAETVPVLSVAGFEGPLDWLLEMAQARKIDLARLSIVALVEAFATALEAALARRIGGREADLARWGAWLVMAASLALLRSRLLLPGDAADARRRRTKPRRCGAGSSTGRRCARRRTGSSAGSSSDATCSGAGQGVVTTAAVSVTSLTCCGACLVVLRVPEQADTYGPRAAPLWQSKRRDRAYAPAARRPT